MANENYFNADVENLVEPLRFKLKDKEYTIQEITPETLDAIQELGERASDEKSTKVSEILAMQLALFTGLEPEEFDGCDVRQLTAVVGWIQSKVNDPEAVAKAKRLAKKK